MAVSTILAGCSGAGEDTANDTVETSESALVAPAPDCIYRHADYLHNNVQIGNYCTSNGKGYTAVVYVDVSGGPDSRCLYIPYGQTISYHIPFGVYNDVRSCKCSGGVCSKP